jgi:hypothetical protein
MLSGSIVLVALALVVVGLLLWRLRQDRRADCAQEVAARVRSVLFRAFGGESLVAVEVRAPSLLRAGRVALSGPLSYHRMLEPHWGGVVAVLPADYELVVRPVLVPRPAAVTLDEVPLRRAA